MKSHTFDDNGYLVPNEVADLDWNAFEELFIFNRQRAELLVQLREFISRVSGWQVPGLQVWVDGSFTTLKPHPNDIDLICFVDNGFYELNLPHLHSVKHDFPKLDIYLLYQKLSSIASQVLFD
nr:hypothetical protein [uncultured Dyadobacter sp.]